MTASIGGDRGTVKAVAGPNGSIFDGNLTVAFVDADHGWLTDTHTLWTTADGGDTWTRTALPVPGSVHGQLDFITTPVVGTDGSAVVVAKYDATPGMDGAPGQRVFYRTVDHGAHWTASSVVADPGTLEISWPIPRPGSCSIRLNRIAADHHGRRATWQTIAVRELWPYNSGPIDFADSLHGWMVSASRNHPAPNLRDAGVRDLRLCLRAAAASLATDDGGATWVELKP